MKRFCVSLLAALFLGVSGPVLAQAPKDPPKTAEQKKAAEDKSAAAKPKKNKKEGC